MRLGREWRRVVGRSDRVISVEGMSTRREKTAEDGTHELSGKIVEWLGQKKRHCDHSGWHGRAARGDPSRCTPPHERQDHGRALAHRARNFSLSLPLPDH